MMGRKSARNMYSRNANKIGIQCICWFYWYFIGITTVHVSDSLSAHHQEFLAIRQHWYILHSCEDRLLPGAGRNSSSILLLVPNGNHNCIKCTKADEWLRTPDDGQKDCPKYEGWNFMATIYLQLIQNRYMFRSFTVLQCSHQHCVQPVASDVEVVGYL